MLSYPAGTKLQSQDEEQDNKEEDKEDDADKDASDDESRFAASGGSSLIGVSAQIKEQ